LKYRRGDVCALSDDICTCGRGFPLLHNLEGRADDFIKLCDGKMIAPPVFHHIINPIEDIHERKVIQEEKDKLIVEFVSGQTNVRRIAIVIKDKLGDAISIEVKPVEMIEGEYSGKDRVVITRVPIN
jgi:phenylacetate-CoA ligase